MTTRDARALLLLDASIVGVAAALVAVEGGRPRLLWDGAHAANAGSVQAIAGLVDSGLAAAKLAWQDVSALVASVGPGSFTGIKVGLAFVYGLRSARLPEVWPTLGLAAIECAAEYRRKALGADSFALLLPATRTHGFLAVATSAGCRSALIDTEGGKSEDLAAWTANPSGKAAWVASEPGDRLAVVGSWPAAEARLIREGYAPLAVAPPEVSRWAIYGMADDAARGWPHAFATEAAPEPRYLRLSTAEEKRAAPPPKSS